MSVKLQVGYIVKNVKLEAALKVPYYEACLSFEDLRGTGDALSKPFQLCNDWDFEDCDAIAETFFRLLENEALTSFHPRILYHDNGCKLQHLSCLLDYVGLEKLSQLTQVLQNVCLCHAPGLRPVAFYETFWRWKLYHGQLIGDAEVDSVIAGGTWKQHACYGQRRERVNHSWYTIHQSTYNFGGLEYAESDKVEYPQAYLFEKCKSRAFFPLTLKDIIPPDCKGKVVWAGAAAGFAASFQKRPLVKSYPLDNVYFLYCIGDWNDLNFLDMLFLVGQSTFLSSGFHVMDNYIEIEMSCEETGTVRLAFCRHVYSSVWELLLRMRCDCSGVAIDEDDQVFALPAAHRAYYFGMNVRRHFTGYDDVLDYGWKMGSIMNGLEREVFELERFRRLGFDIVGLKHVNDRGAFVRHEEQDLCRRYFCVRDLCLKQSGRSENGSSMDFLYAEGLPMGTGLAVEYVPQRNGLESRGKVLQRHLFDGVTVYQLDHVHKLCRGEAVESFVHIPTELLYKCPFSKRKLNLGNIKLDDGTVYWYFTVFGAQGRWGNIVRFSNALEIVID